MELQISNSSTLPIYEQISSQIKSNIMSGELAIGEALPSIRTLATALGVSVLTVQRAYENLRQDGFAESVAGRGTFVAEHNKETIRAEKLREIEDNLEETSQIARTYGISLEMIQQLLELYYYE